MRVRTFVKQDSDGHTYQLPFTEKHFKEAGTLVTPAIGMHKITAIELVNKWNAESTGTKYWVQ